MRRFASIGFFLLLTVSIARAEENAAGGVHLSVPTERAELVAVVTAQLEAFRAEKWDEAYALSARTFQHVVAPQAFVTLITRNYSIILENTRAEFGMPSDNGRVAIVPVRVFRQGVSEPYTWMLVREDGKWRITGVVPQRSRGGA